jgi:hypothetical protein
LFAEGRLGERDRIQLFEWDDALLAVGVFSPESDATVHVGFVGLRYDVHGARIDDPDGPRLSDSIVVSCLAEAESMGFQRATAQVARANVKAGALLTRVGFTAVSRFDADYDLWATEWDRR